MSNLKKINNNITSDSESESTQSENLTASDSESEQEAAHKNSDFDLIMKRIANLEAENSRLQILLKNKTSGSLDENSNESKEKKKSKHVRFSYESCVDKREVNIYLF